MIRSITFKTFRHLTLLLLAAGLVAVGLGAPPAAHARELTGQLGAAPQANARLAVATYTLRLTGRTSATTGQSVSLVAHTSSKLRGKTVYLQRYRSGAWRTTAKKLLRSTGRATFKVTHPTAGTARYRALVRPRAGAKFIRSARLSVSVKAAAVSVPPPVVAATPAPVETAPETSAPPVEAPPAFTAPPAGLPPIPDLPPYSGTTTSTFSHDVAPSSATASGMTRYDLLPDAIMSCGGGTVSVAGQYAGIGNGNEWEWWLPTLYGYYPATQTWGVVAYGNWHYRDSGSHPLLGHLGGPGAWLTYPSGEANARAQWSWNVNRGAYYAVVNWKYAQSRGWVWSVSPVVDTGVNGVCYVA